MAADVVGADHDDRSLGTEVVEFMAVGDAPENVAGLIAADAQVHWLEGTEVFLPGFLAFPAVRDGVAQENDVAQALAFLDPSEELLVPRDVAVELLDSRVVRGLLLRSEGGRQQAKSQHAAGGGHAVHNNLVCDRVSPLTLPGILANGWLALQELGRHKAAALQIRRRLTNTVDVTAARNAALKAPREPADRTGRSQDLDMVGMGKPWGAPPPPPPGLDIGSERDSGRLCGNGECLGV